VCCSKLVKETKKKNGANNLAQKPIPDQNEEDWRTPVQYFKDNGE